MNFVFCLSSNLNVETNRNSPERAGPQEGPITFICHSLGGLIVKQIVLDLDTAGAQAIFDKKIAQEEADRRKRLPRRRVRRVASQGRRGDAQVFLTRIS